MTAVGGKGAAPRDAYAAAGVDVAAGDHAVELLRARIAGAGALGADLLGGLGGFGAALELPEGYRRPVLVSATDGVGTKTEIARRMGRRETIGQDLVAMCVDDLVCHGAQPLFFLDYLAVGRLVPAEVADLVAGIADGCAIAGCALVGGETAEHPGVMEPDAFDLAGFAVGIVERDRLLDRRAARAGDVVLGLASSGFHSNGYSLVRRVLADEPLDGSFAALVARVLGEGEAAGLADADRAATLGEVLLRPTRIHAPVVLALRAALDGAGRGLTGVAHITGGGVPGNLPRALGDDLAARVDPAAWPVPVEMRVVAALAGLSGAEVRATFNAGVGMALVVDPVAEGAALAWLREAGVAAWPIGIVEPAVDGIRYREGAA
ncbi:MAG: phosphoribosylformylglycinamidine cyclo-ligase [Chloroflexota bacterium]